MRGATTVEPTQEAQDGWIAHLRATAVDTSQFARECTPSYFNNEGEEKLRWIFGEPYGPGFYAFEDLLAAWRASGDLAGLELGFGSMPGGPHQASDRETEPA